MSDETESITIGMNDIRASIALSLKEIGTYIFDCRDNELLTGLEEELWRMVELLFDESNQYD